jgi:predicted dehydrogenase
MPDTVRWGILGAANFALEQMAPAIHAARGAELAALATTNPSRAAMFQDFAPGLRVQDSYDALLADPAIDAVYIPLPNHLHVEWTLKAIAAGKHVLCEKPLAMQAGQFDAVIAARDAAGVLAAEAYMIVHHPQFIRARDLVQGGAIGQLCHVDCHFSYNNAADMTNIRNRPETGGGALPDIGVYAIGAARFVTGTEPLSVEWADIRRENGVDVVSRFSAAFPGFSYSGLVSMRMFNRQEITFTGDEGLLRLTCPFNPNVHDMPRLELETAGMTVTVERFPGVNHYILQVENFGRSVREGVAYPCPLEFSRGTQAMIDMVFAAGGRD